MRSSERFAAMKRFEEVLRPLTEEKWRVEDLTYEDIDGEPFRVMLKARLETQDPKDGIR